MRTLLHTTASLRAAAGFSSSGADAIADLAAPLSWCAARTARATRCGLRAAALNVLPLHRGSMRCRARVTLVQRYRAEP